MNKKIDIFDFEARRNYQLSTWKRTDIPTEVITMVENGAGDFGGKYKRQKYNNFAQALQDFPHLKLSQGMRGQWRGKCEYVLRFEEYPND